MPLYILSQIYCLDFLPNHNWQSRVDMMCQADYIGLSEVGTDHQRVTIVITLHLTPLIK